MRDRTVESQSNRLVAVVRCFKLLIQTAKKEDGAVEAGLTLIPLTILFLISAQLVFASHWGNAQHVDQQSRTNRVAISGTFADETNKRSGESFRYEPLLGGGYLVVSQQGRPIPFLANFPGLSTGDFIYQKRVTAVSEVFTQ